MLNICKPSQDKPVNRRTAADQTTKIQFLAKPSLLSQAITLQEVTSSDLDRDKHYLDYNIPAFLFTISNHIPESTFRGRPNHFLPNPFQFISHLFIIVSFELMQVKALTKLLSEQ
jgi:hypothetical protein